MNCLTLPEESAALYDNILNDERVLIMRKYRQHGQTSTYEHCINVTRASCRIAVRFGLDSSCLNNIIIGAMLHDFYLYDWHTTRFRKEGLHGFSHPKVALKNADALFNLNDKQRNIIQSHMFPLTLLHPPKCKEAWVVVIADKYCAVQEYIAPRFKRITKLLRKTQVTLK